MEDSQLAEIRKLNELVSELLNVVRVTAYPSLKTTIVAEFGDTENDKGAAKIRRQVYALSNGANSSREIEKLLSGAIKFQAVARYQQQWRKQGLATTVGGQGKTKAIFNLEDFGLEAELPASTKPATEPQTTTLPLVRAAE